MSLKKKLKKLGKKVKKAAKTVGRAAAKAVKYAAPVVGTLVAGPLGGLAGTALSGAASQVGPNKNRAKALKRALIYGGSVTAGAAAIGVVSGAGAGASLIQSVPRLLGGAPATPASGSEGLDQAFIDRPTQDGGELTDLSGAFLTSPPGGGGGLGSLFSGSLPGRTVDGGEAGERGGGPVGDLMGMYGSSGLEEGGAQGEGINPWWIVGGVGALFLLSRKKAS